MELLDLAMINETVENSRVFTGAEVALRCKTRREKSVLKEPTEPVRAACVNIKGLQVYRLKGSPSAPNLHRRRVNRQFRRSLL